MIPGQIFPGEGDIEINAGATRLELEIVNTGDRPVLVGSHVHLPQANAALSFDRSAAHGHRLTSRPAPQCASNLVLCNGLRWSRSAAPASFTD